MSQKTFFSLERHLSFLLRARKRKKAHLMLEESGNDINVFIPETSLAVTVSLYSVLLLSFVSECKASEFLQEGGGIKLKFKGCKCWISENFTLKQVLHVFIVHLWKR